jgi:hypothetical protein
VNVFHACIIAGWKPADGRPPTKAALGNLIQRAGVQKFWTKFIEVLTSAVSSDEDLERAQRREAEDAEGKKDGEAAAQP